MMDLLTKTLLPSQSPIFIKICRTYPQDLWQILLEKVQKLAEKADWHKKVTYTFIKEMELGRSVCI